MSFLDASKAFDLINHSILFNKLIKRGVCGYLIRIIIYWYETQTMCVRWGNLTSGSFNVSNGIRQGGILSPLFFNVYVDDLSVQLNKLNIGCISKDMIINHLMYADDLVLISPSTAGLQQLIDICQRFGVAHDIIFNPTRVNSLMMCSQICASFRPFYIIILNILRIYSYAPHRHNSNGTSMSSVR